MIEEIWKPVAGFEEAYEVSTFGRVRSLKCRWGIRSVQKFLVPRRSDKYGHLKVALRKPGFEPKNFFVHRLVAMAFIPNPCNFPFINHKDENPSNNCVDNLEWCDCKYNNNYGTHNKRMAKSLEGKEINHPDKSKRKALPCMTSDSIEERMVPTGGCHFPLIFRYNNAVSH